MIQTDQKPYFTTGEIGRLLHVTRVTVYRWIKLGRLKAARVHQGKYRISTEVFATFVKQHELENSIASEIPARPIVRILVVDDESDAVWTVKTFLEKENPHYHVVGTTCGFEAGGLMSSFRPKVVILNFDMKGVDGFNVCRKIKSDPQTRKTGIIAITGRSSGKRLERIKKEYARIVLTKPLDYRRLLSSVERLTK